jgi:hypothetical protein
MNMKGSTEANMKLNTNLNMNGNINMRMKSTKKKILNVDLNPIMQQETDF